MDQDSRRAGYSTREVASLLSVSPAQVRASVRAGFVRPQTGPQGEMWFAFQDVVLLRTARALQAARIPRRRIRAVLQGLHAQLPQGHPLTGVRISAQGGALVARDGGEAWDPESGQTLLDFAATQHEGLREGTSGAVISTSTRLLPALGRGRSMALAAADPAAAGEPDAGPRLVGPAGSMGPHDADEMFELGVMLEGDDPTAAMAAYRRALQLDPELADAHLNLGRLLHEASDPAGAETHYRSALTIRPDDALAAYNLGVALEDQQRLQPAADAYLQALDLDPQLADAHFNLSGVYEQLGDLPAAFRHLRTYRSLTSGRGAPS